jgi:hypothetical protein
VVLDASLRGKPCGEVVAELKKRAPTMPMIVIRGAGGPECDGADHYLDVFEPEPLLRLLKRLYPRAVEEIERQDERLHRQGE